MAVFILGAGATRGASFVDPQKNPCLPPLDADFYNQLQRIRDDKHKNLVNNVIEDTVELFGTNFRITMETAFTIIDQMTRMVTTTGETRDFKRKELEEKKNRLIQAIAAVLEKSMCEPESRKSRDCEYHKKLIDMLKSDDRIITFNYDCLIDEALKNYGTGKWNPRYGYGFKLGSGGKNLRGDQHWQPGTPVSKDESVKVYKLHGSLHFRISKDQVILKQRPYTKQAGNLKFTIIPPESSKRYDTGVFAHLWKQAGQAIHNATTLVIIGYSIPATDSHANALLRLSVKKEGLKSLVIVNPDREARYRTREVVKRGLSPNTRVLVFDTLKEFVAVERQLWEA
jgi:hypothetical protein